MRRKYHIITACTILILVGMAFFAPQAHAQAGTIFKLFGFDIWDFIAEMLAILSQWVLSIMVLWVALTGALLNVSIILTLHIKDFVNSVSGVYLVWQTIRDISSLFIIFALLYCSFLLILDQTSKSFGSVGNLIKNIVIGGILINFSFFITSLLIDASNIVSLALYNGIVETPSTAAFDPKTGALDPKTIVSNSMSPNSDGGLSGLFMKYIAPQSIVSPDTIKLTDQGKTSSGFSKPLEIVIQGIVGVIIMFTSGMSFLLAALAFVARLAILIVLLAFSPIWFASLIFPILKEKFSKHFTDQLYAQLVFMPIYLLLMYAALRVLSSSTIFSNPTTNVFQGSNGLSTTVWTNLMVLAINDFFIIFLLNLPLVVAFSYGGSATDWLGGAVKKMGAANVWKNVGSWTGSRTLGRAAYSANESGAMKRLASLSPTLGGFASKGLSGVSSAGFGMKKRGYEDALKAKKKLQEDMHERLGRVERSDYATEAEFEDAQKDARTYQEKYRAKLPWKSGIMGFMLDNRANNQSQRSLYDEYGAKKDLNKLLGIKLDRDGNQVLEDKTERSKESLEYAYLKKRAAEGGDTVTNAEKTRLAELKETEHELNAAIKRGGKSKGKKDYADVIKKLAEEAKKEGLGEEKPKEEKPKPKEESEKP